MVQSSSDQLFVIEEGGKLRSEPWRSMRDGVLGKSLEDGLQALIEQYPQVIPGTQIEPGSDNPPKFVLLFREMPVGSWSLDLLLVDQFGVPTLVEAKLIENPESRRSVVGQILEYAANAASEWGNGRLQQKAAEYWAKKDRTLEDVLREIIDDVDNFDIDKFWEKVEQNLAKGKMRLLVATDRLRPEVRRIIEYLNGETKNIEILGLELRCYGTSTTSLILSPLVVGQTQVTATTKGVSLPSKDWEAVWKEELTALNSDAIDLCKEILEWAETTAGISIKWSGGPVQGGFKIVAHHNGTAIPVMFVEISGPADRPGEGVRGYFQYGKLRKVSPFTDKCTARELVEKLNEIGFKIRLDIVDDTTDNLRPGFSLTLLQKKESMKQFLDTLQWIVEQIQESSEITPES